MNFTNHLIYLSCVQRLYLFGRPESYFSITYLYFVFLSFSQWRYAVFQSFGRTFSVSNNLCNFQFLFHRRKRYPSFRYLAVIQAFIKYTINFSIIQSPAGHRGDINNFKRRYKEYRVINDPTGSDGTRSSRGIRSSVPAAGFVSHTGVTPRRVGDVYVGAPVHVTGAALAARAPCTVEEAGELLAPRRGADHRFRREVRR